LSEGRRQAATTGAHGIAETLLVFPSVPPEPVYEVTGCTKNAADFLVGKSLEHEGSASGSTRVEARRMLGKNQGDRIDEIAGPAKNRQDEVSPVEDQEYLLSAAIASNSSKVGAPVCTPRARTNPNAIYKIPTKNFYTANFSIIGTWEVKTHTVNATNWPLIPNLSQCRGRHDYACGYSKGTYTSHSDLRCCRKLRALLAAFQRADDRTERAADGL